MKEKIIAIVAKMEEEDLKTVLANIYEEGTVNDELYEEVREVYREVFFG